LVAILLFYSLSSIFYQAPRGFRLVNDGLKSVADVTTPLFVNGKWRKPPVSARRAADFAKRARIEAYANGGSSKNGSSMHLCVWFRNIF
jgi:hypothetical protein